MCACAYFRYQTVNIKDSSDNREIKMKSKEINLGEINTHVSDQNNTKQF